MPTYAIKTMQELCKYMQKYAVGNMLLYYYMHKYSKYARENMPQICNYMQKYVAQNMK